MSENQDLISATSNALLPKLADLIDNAKKRVSNVVNSELTFLYWQVGAAIREYVLEGERAKYGKQVIKRVSVELTERYGKGWGPEQLRHCIRVAEIFPDKQILYTLCIELSWSHIRKLIFINDPLKREFYAEMAKLEGWGVRALNDRINSMLYERTAISKKPEETIKNELKDLNQDGKTTEDLTFRDPYILDFLGLSDSYSEHDLESAILAELQQFIIEFGTDFTFVGRQKRLTIDNRDYYIDLLFFHRRLRCLVAIDLKIGEFEANFKGQMELYLRYLEKHEKLQGENTPIGLILCSGKSEEHIELLRLQDANIKVAEYLTELPSKKILQDKLHQSIERAKKRISFLD